MWISLLSLHVGTAWNSHLRTHTHPNSFLTVCVPCAVVDHAILCDRDKAERIADWKMATDLRCCQGRLANWDAGEAAANAWAGKNTQGHQASLSCVRDNCTLSYMLLELPNTTSFTKPKVYGGLEQVHQSKRRWHYKTSGESRSRASFPPAMWVCNLPATASWHWNGSFFVSS